MTSLNFPRTSAYQNQWKAKVCRCFEFYFAYTQNYVCFYGRNRDIEKQNLFYLRKIHFFHLKGISEIALDANVKFEIEIVYLLSQCFRSCNTKFVSVE